jgi:hypothetical protein
MATTSEGTVPFRGYRTWYRVVGELPAASGKLPLLVVHGVLAFPTTISRTWLAWRTRDERLSSTTRSAAVSRIIRTTALDLPVLVTSGGDDEMTPALVQPLVDGI